SRNTAWPARFIGPTRDRRRVPRRRSEAQQPVRLRRWSLARERLLPRTDRLARCRQGRPLLARRDFRPGGLHHTVRRGNADAPRRECLPLRSERLTLDERPPPRVARCATD